MPGIAHVALLIGIGLSAIGLGAAASSAEDGTPQATELASGDAGDPAPRIVGDMTMAVFLDRLMAAESGGRDDVANPRSTAVGAYQFIVGTFLDVARRHFAADTKDLAVEQILALRKNRTFARRAAEAYTLDNARLLAAANLPASWTNLRLAFLLGGEGAIKVLKAPPETALVRVLSKSVIEANPFMARLTAAGLIARSAREVALSPLSVAGVGVPPTAPSASGSPPDKLALPRVAAPRVIDSVKCSLELPSCRRWLALAEQRAIKLAKGKRRTAAK